MHLRLGRPHTYQRLRLTREQARGERRGEGGALLVPRLYERLGRGRRNSARRVEARQEQPNAFARRRQPARTRRRLRLEALRRLLHKIVEGGGLELLEDAADGAQPHVALTLARRAHDERLVAILDGQAALDVVARVAARAHLCDRRVELQRLVGELRVVLGVVVPHDSVALQQHAPVPPAAAQVQVALEDEADAAHRLLLKNAFQDRRSRAA